MDSIKELIYKIKLRPAMYITWNDIFCLKAFLDGWYLRDINNVSDLELMSDFQKWIEQSYRITTSHSWAHILLFFSSDNRTALENFFKEFDVFISERESK